MLFFSGSQWVAEQRWTRWVNRSSHDIILNEFLISRQIIEIHNSFWRISQVWSRVSAGFISLDLVTIPFFCCNCSLSAIFIFYLCCIIRNIFWLPISRFPHAHSNPWVLLFEYVFVCVCMCIWFICPLQSVIVFHTFDVSVYEDYPITTVWSEQLTSPYKLLNFLLLNMQLNLYHAHCSTQWQTNKAQPLISYRLVINFCCTIFFFLYIFWDPFRSTRNKICIFFVPHSLATVSSYRIYLHV